MSFTCGFYNSQDGDRVYSTSQISDFLNGLVTDGVYQHINDGDHYGLQVVEQTPQTMGVNISIGKAWFNSTWSKVTSPEPVTIPGSSALLNRIDAVCLTVNTNRSVRNNYFEVISGTETSGTPEKPTVVDEPNIYRHVLAWVTVNAGVSRITNANIERNIGTDDVPFVKGIIDAGVTVDQLNTQWKAEFMEWFDYMKDQLTEDAAGTLQAEIDALRIHDTVIDNLDNYENLNINLIIIDDTFSVQKGTVIIHDFKRNWEFNGDGTPSISVNGDNQYSISTIHGATIESTAVFKTGTIAYFWFNGNNWVWINPVDNTKDGVEGSMEPITSGAVHTTVEEMKQTFQDGVDAVYNALVDIGVTPASSTPTAIAEAVANANKGAWTGATTGSGNVTIPAGFHNGSGYVSGSGAYNAGCKAKSAHTLKLDPNIYGELLNGGRNVRINGNVGLRCDNVLIMEFSFDQTGNEDVSYTAGVSATKYTSQFYGLSN